MRTVLLYSVFCTSSACVGWKSLWLDSYFLSPRPQLQEPLATMKLSAFAVLGAAAAVAAAKSGNMNGQYAVSSVGDINTSKCLNIS